jgi:hypothetical protein
VAHFERAKETFIRDLSGAADVENFHDDA